jgi:hypothetical protein
MIYMAAGPINLHAVNPCCGPQPEVDPSGALACVPVSTVDLTNLRQLPGLDLNTGANPVSI